MAGMTEDQFWNGDNLLPIAYRKKLELEDRRFNERAWLQGRYDFIAVSLAVTNAFRDKGHKANDYPDKPFEIPDGHEPTDEEKAREQERALNEGIRFLDDMMAKARGRSDGSSS